jgi:hypothetical protein
LFPCVPALTGRLLAVALGIVILAPAWADPSPTRAADTVESVLVGELFELVNDARVGMDLRPLRADVDLTKLASLRADHMAGTGQLSHTTYGGSLSDALSATGQRFVSAGEAVGTYTGLTPERSAHPLFQLWRGSTPHWELISSVTFNYVGVGVSVRADGAVFAALLFAETTDRTPPTATITSRRALGGTVSWTWSGADPLLQTRTAGLCSFDVQYRLGSGAWKLVRARTSARSMSLAGRQRGTLHAARVRARDCAGNLSGWSAAKPVRVP